MKRFKFIFFIFILALLIQPVSAMEYSAPAAPDSAQKYMPKEVDSFWDSLWFVIKSALLELQPGIAEASKTCVSVIAIAILLSVIQCCSGISKQIVALVGAISLGMILFRASNSLICLGTDTVVQISDYGKLLLPILTAASAASGAPVASSGLYTGTVIFSTLLSGLISHLVVPLIYIMMALSIADSVFVQQTLKGLKDFAKWLATWIVKTVLYIFIGYMSITGVVGGSADAAAVKAAKLTISGAVPVVGGIISDASESILLSARIMKNTAGIYGLIATVAICVAPFLRIGLHYLLLKLTGAICGVFGNQQVGNLMKDMTTAMGLVLAMTGTVSLLLLIGTVCFLRSVV